MWRNSRNHAAAAAAAEKNKSGDDGEEESMPARGTFSVIETKALIAELCALAYVPKRAKRCAVIGKKILITSHPQPLS